MICFSGTLTAYQAEDGTLECEGFTDKDVVHLARRFLGFGFGADVNLIVKKRQGKTESEIATIKLSDPVRNRDFNPKTFELGNV